MILLDTHVLLWLRAGDARLGRRARDEIDRAWHAGDLATSAISFWEVAMLNVKGRIKMADDVRSWRRQQLEQGMVEIAVSGEICIRAASLVGFHGDPADRIIVATGQQGHRLVTADARILGWSGQLSRLPATD